MLNLHLLQIGLILSCACICMHWRVILSIHVRNCFITRTTKVRLFMTEAVVNIFVVASFDHNWRQQERERERERESRTSPMTSPMPVTLPSVCLERPQVNLNRFLSWPFPASVYLFSSFLQTVNSK